VTSDTRAVRPAFRLRVSPAARIALAILLLAAAGRVISDRFLTVINLLNTVQAVALLGIVAVGVGFVTYTGHYADLSVPSIMALSGIVAVSALRFGIGASLAAGLAAGMAVGAGNGIAIGYARANPIIWTLASGSVVGGAIRWLYSGSQVYPDSLRPAGRAFLGLYGASLFGVIPATLCALALLAAAAHMIMTRTAYGGQARLTGAAYDVARMSGVDVKRIVALAFLASSLAASIGGILLTSLNKVGAPYIGRGYDFLSVTAVVLGGVSLAGGRGTIPGVLCGVLIIGVLRNLLALLGIGTFAQEIVQGAVFILVVGVSSLMLRRAGRDDA
jgi:ribose/xylose/arabinose/galactoside ABC-type transport system permease subunit